MSLLLERYQNDCSQRYGNETAVKEDDSHWYHHEWIDSSMYWEQMEQNHERSNQCSKSQDNWLSRAFSTSLISVGEWSKVGWVDVSLSEGWIMIWLFWWLSIAFVRIWGLDFGLTHLGLALLCKGLCERLSEPFLGFFSFFHRLKKMSATFIVVASKHAVGTKLRNSLVDDFLPFSSCTHS